MLDALLNYSPDPLAEAEREVVDTARKYYAIMQQARHSANFDWAKRAALIELIAAVDNLNYVEANPLFVS